MEREHHKYGPSRWPALLCCPNHSPTGETTDAAKHGTKNHEQLEACLRSGDPSLTDEGGVAFAAGWILRESSGRELHIEEKVTITDPLIPQLDEAFGYVDVWWTSGRTLHVCDFKSGSGSSLPQMAQLMGYAYALTTMLSPGSIDERRILLHVVYGGEFSVKTVEVSAVDCYELAKDVARRIENPSAFKENINIACRWCSRLGQCRTAERAVKEFEEETKNMNDTEKLEHFAKIRGIISAEEDRIKASIEVGAYVESGGVRYTKTHRDGKATSTDVKALIEMAGSDGVAVDSDAVLGACSLSKSAWKSVAKGAAKAAGKKLSDLDDMYNACSQFGAGYDMLVRSEVA